MSKTIDLQIEKMNMLLKGFNSHLDDLRDKGVTVEELKKMENDLTALKAANDRCDALRRELSAKVKEMNAILSAAKVSFAEKKKIIKGYYLQGEWQKYGVMDKR